MLLFLLPNCLPSPFIQVDMSSVSLIVSYTRVEVTPLPVCVVRMQVPALRCLSLRGMPFYSSVCFSVRLNRLENEFCKKNHAEFKVVTVKKYELFLLRYS